MARHAVFMLLAAFVMLGAVMPAHADVVQCGDVLGPGGRFTLEQDVVCQGETLGPGVTVQDGAILDLNGHTVNCQGLNGPCVLLAGKGAKLLNGRLANALHENITLSGTGGHTVRNVTSVFVDGNVFVTSDHNTLIDVVAETGLSQAFQIRGHHNRLLNSIGLCSLDGTECIEVIGNGNHLIGNFVEVGLNRNGITVSGNNNVLTHNRAISLRSSGGQSRRAIVVTGTGNRITHNTAITENATDLQDSSGDCAHNTWRRNIFVTSDPACIR